MLFALEALGMFGGVRFSIAAADVPVAMRPEMAREAKNFMMREKPGTKDATA
jgi:hypothetical protein